MDASKEKRATAIRALVNLAMLEGFILVAVVGVYLYTNNIIHLIGGIIGSTLIFGPMFFRWHKEHGAALRASSSAGEGRGE